MMIKAILSQPAQTLPIFDNALPEEPFTQHNFLVSITIIAALRILHYFTSMDVSTNPTDSGS